MHFQPHANSFLKARHQELVTDPPEKLIHSCPVVRPSGPNKRPCVRTWPPLLRSPRPEMGRVSAPSCRPAPSALETPAASVGLRLRLRESPKGEAAGAPESTHRTLKYDMSLFQVTEKSHRLAYFFFHRKCAIPDDTLYSIVTFPEYQKKMNDFCKNT